MAGASLVDRLKERFGESITGAELDVLDPWVEVSPDGLVSVCEFLRDDPEWQLDMLNCITAVDYFEPDEKKAKKASWEPHVEVVYHLSSIGKKHTLVLKVMTPRWKGDEPGELPEVP